MFDDVRYRLPYLAEESFGDPQEAAFLTSILENPDDDAPRLIFADWLEDNGKADKAAFVRLEVEMSRLPSMEPRYEDIRNELLQLDYAIGGKWSVALVRPGRLLNCGRPSARAKKPAVRFAFECPKRWADLKATGDPNVRHCPSCRKDVHHCASEDDAQLHAGKGHCIAISSRLALTVVEKYPPPDREFHMTLGIVSMDAIKEEDFGIDKESPYYRWAEELFARHGKRWWEFWR